MSSVIERMERELAYLESLSPQERATWANVQNFEYDPIWDDIFEFNDTNIPENSRFIVLCENYNEQTTMSTSNHKLNNMPGSGKNMLMAPESYDCVFDAIAVAA